MKNTTANALRAKYLEILMSALSKEEYVGQIASNSFNFPIVTEDGEEGWVEVVVKIPKEDGDEGFLKRESFVIAQKERAEKAEAKAIAKAKKIERDKAQRAKAKEGS